MTTQLPPAIAQVASQAEAEAGTATDKFMTPERTAQAIAAQVLSVLAALEVTASLSDDDIILECRPKTTNATTTYQRGAEFFVGQSGSVNVFWEQSRAPAGASSNVQVLLNGVAQLTGDANQTGGNIDLNVTKGDYIEVKHRINSAGTSTSTLDRAGIRATGALPQWGCVVPNED